MRFTMDDGVVLDTKGQPVAFVASRLQGTAEERRVADALNVTGALSNEALAQAVDGTGAFALVGLEQLEHEKRRAFEAGWLRAVDEFFPGGKMVDGESKMIEQFAAFLTVGV